MTEANPLCSQMIVSKTYGLCRRSMFWFGLFMTASVSMVIFNKLVMQTYNYSTFLLIIQNTITIVLNLVGTKAGSCPVICVSLNHSLYPVTSLGRYIYHERMETRALQDMGIANSDIFNHACHKVS